MLTRCPYVDCAHVFESSDKIASCPRCTRPGTVRPEEIWQHIDKQCARLMEQGRLAQSDKLSLPSAPSLVAIAEDIRSLWNVGSIFRTADGAGCSLVLLTGITGTPPRKEIAKTSLSAEDAVPWLYAPSVTTVLPTLRENDFTVIGLERTSVAFPLQNAVGLAEGISRTDSGSSICLVVGNEVTGLSREALDNCDLICDLPMRGKKESLNVAVAFGIAAYMAADRIV